MHMSSKGLALLKKNEGCVLRAYLCPAGVWTIGYGSTGPHVRPNSVITKAEAEALLIQDLNRFEIAVSKAVAPKIPMQEEFDAMVSLAFNIGIGSFNKSSVVRKYKAGDKAGAANAFGMWNKARVRGKLTVLPGLVRRRAEEAQLFLSATEDAVVTRAHSNPAKLAFVPEESVAPEAPKSLAKSREVILGSGLGIGGVVQTVNTLTNGEWTEVKAGVEQVGTTLTGGVWEQLYIPEITSLLAAAIGMFMIYKRFKDRKEGIR
jgi:lysozyme